eukprot:11450810-Alexandrium_andersonii.AAC.1
MRQRDCAAEWPTSDGVISERSAISHGTCQGCPDRSTTSSWRQRRRCTRVTPRIGQADLRAAEALRG